MSKSQWGIARPNEAKLQEILENGCDWERLAQSLLSWLSDDEVGDFARSYGYFDEDEEEDENEEGDGKNIYGKFIQCPFSGRY